MSGVTTDAMLQAMRAQRSIWVNLTATPDSAKGGRKVQIIRPREAEILKDFVKTEGDKRIVSVDVDQVVNYVVGWAGFTERDLVGPNGADTAVAFDRALWAEYVPDHLDEMTTVAKALLNAIDAWSKQKAEIEKN